VTAGENLLMTLSAFREPSGARAQNSNCPVPPRHLQMYTIAIMVFRSHLWFRSVGECVMGICMFLSSLFLFFHMYYLMLTIYGSSRILLRHDLMSRAHTLHNLNFTSFVQHTHTRTQYIRVQCSASRTGLVKHLITLYRRYTHQ
jgi:hypothetical protein